MPGVFEPNNFYPSAQVFTLGSLTVSGGLTVSDFVNSSTDGADIFRFTLTANSTFQATLSGLSGDADIYLLTAAGTETNTYLLASVNAGTTTDTISVLNPYYLTPGDYYLGVWYYYSATGSVNYTLNTRVTQLGTADGAGNTTSAARDIGTLTSTPQNFSDFVGASDLYDYYRFTVTSASTFSAALTGMSADADISLLNSGGTVLTGSYAASNVNDYITNFNINAGTYYVRVNRFSGDTNYNLQVSSNVVVPVDTGGDSYGAATSVGVLGSTNVVRNGFVGSADQDDIYTFTTLGTTNFNLTMTGMSADADVWLVASNQSTILRYSVNGSNLNESITYAGLAAGQYYVHVYQYSGDTNYTLTMNAVGTAAPDYAGNSLAAARDVGALGSLQTFTDAVSSADTNDFYRFTLTGPSVVTLNLTGMSQDGDLQLQSSTGVVLASSVAAGNANDSITTGVLSAGTYYARVYPYGGANTNYTLGLSATATAPADTGGNTAGGATVIGPLGATPTIVNGFVGDLDEYDYYTFTLGASSNVTVNLTGLSADADVMLLNSGQSFVNGSANWGTLNDTFTSSGLAAGQYYIAVYQYSGNTNYNLSVTATGAAPADTAGNTRLLARNLGTLSSTPTTVIDEFVGSADTNDFFSFNVAYTSDVTINLTGMSADGDLQLLGSTGTVIASSILAGAANDSIVRTLTAGTYYARVYPYGSANTTYDLSLVANEVAQSDISGALLNLGNITSTVVTRSDEVGSFDTEDVYTLTLLNPGQLRVTLTGMTADADVQIRSSDGTEVFAYGVNGGSLSELVTVSLGADSYQVRVYQYAGDTNYTLGVSATTVVDGAGNTALLARNVGALTNAAVTFSDFMGSGDYDYYRFTTAGPANFVLTMTGMSADADVQLLAADGITELDYSDAGGAGNERIDYAISGAGTYYVRVYPYTGENTAYTLSMSAAPAVGDTDNTMGSATALGTLSPTNIVRTNSVGSGDTQDYFSFNLATPGNFRLTLTGMTADADVQVLNSTGGVIAYSIAASNISEAINLNGLGAGDYYVRVYQYAGNTNYTLTVRSELASVADGAGNSFAAARVVPALTTAPQVFTDFVGTADEDDYYRITIGANASLDILLDGMTTDADVYVYNSAFGLVDSSIAGGNAPDQIDVTGLTAGTYYVRVTQYSGDTNYRLTMASQAASDPAGQTYGAALDLGRIGSAARVTSGFVGTGDTSDWYAFDTGYTSNFRLILNGLTADADVRLFAADGTTQLGWSAAAGAAADNIAINGLAAGEYFVQVYQYAGNTNYNLSLQALAPADTAPNTAATGRVLTLGPTPITVRETVGDIDTNDYYRFTLAQRSEVSLALGALTGNANFELYSGNLLIGSGTQTGTTGELLTFTGGNALNSGTYVLRVMPGELGANADYTLTASATTVTPPDTAGSDGLTARTIAVSATQLNITEFVGTGVTPADPADFYRFGLTAVSGLRVSLTGMPVDPAQVALYGPDGTTVITQSRTATDGTLEYDRLGAGTYFLGVTPASGDYAPYTLGVRSLVADDFASSTASTGRVSVNATATVGNIETANDVDWFRVSLTGGTRYVIRQQGLPGGGGTLSDTFIRGIYDSSGNLIEGTANDDSEATLNSMVTFTPGLTGDYFIAAGAFATNIGTYRISATTSNLAPVVGVVLAPVDAREGQAFAFHLPWQLFTDPEGQNVTISATLSDGRPLPTWLTYDAASQTLSATSVPVNAPDLTIRLTGTDPQSASASTNLVIRTPAGTDDFASNINTAGVVTVGGTARGNIETARDSDWFLLDNLAAGTYTIDLRGRPSNNGTNPDPYLLGIYNASGTLISGTTNDDAGGSLDSRLVFTASSPGDYFIAAGAYADNIGTYLVAVTAASTNQAPVIAQPIADQRVREGVAFSFTLPAGTFTDPNSDALTYTFNTGTSATPTWLQFNAATRTFTGTAPANSPDLVVNVTARDAAGLAITDQFTLFTDAAAPGTGTGTGGGQPAVQTDNWTLMIYIAADNNLESFALGDINEMELVNLPSSVNVVVLVDRAAGFSTADGNWTDTRRGQITFHSNASTIGSTLTSIGERNTGDPATLTEFINWGAQNYRANNYGLVIWDHGGGLSGTAWDDASGGANLSIAETTRAIQNSTLGRVDFLGFDTCLQGMIEQAMDVRTVADVVVASQKLEPGDGWDYTRWLQPLVATPNATDLQMGSYAVAGYDAFYSSPETLTAVDTSLLDELTTAMNTFVNAALPNLSGNNATLDEQRLRLHRSQATVVYSGTPDYRDLGNFMSRIAADTNVSTGIRNAATGVFNALDAATYASTNVSGFNGLSVFLPGTTTASELSSYTSSNYRFLADTNWRGFLGAMNS